MDVKILSSCHRLPLLSIIHWYCFDYYCYYRFLSISFPFSLYSISISVSIFSISPFSKLSFSTSAFLSPFSDSLEVIFCMNKTWFDRHMSYGLDYLSHFLPDLLWMREACLYGCFHSC